MTNGAPPARREIALPYARERAVVWKLETLTAKPRARATPASRRRRAISAGATHDALPASMYTDTPGWRESLAVAQASSEVRLPRADAGRPPSAASASGSSTTAAGPPPRPSARSAIQAR